MNVYDFDGTIYDGDSTLDFYRFILLRRPSVLLDLPAAILYFIKFKLGKCTKTEFKQCFFRFLKRIPDIDVEIALFWSKKKSKIKKFYVNIAKDDDLVISASPAFLLEPICPRLIASDVDKKDGAFKGANCCGAEKLRRLREKFGKDVGIDKFYSDSASDAPLAELANAAYFVKGNKITVWRK